MDVTQAPNMAEPITIPETAVVKNGKSSNKDFGKKLNRKLFFFRKLSLIPLAPKVLCKNNKKERTCNCLKAR